MGNGCFLASSVMKAPPPIEKEVANLIEQLKSETGASSEFGYALGISIKRLCSYGTEAPKHFFITYDRAMDLTLVNKIIEVVDFWTRATFQRTYRLEERLQEVTIFRTETDERDQLGILDHMMISPLSALILPNHL